MSRLSKKEIKAALEKLREPKEGQPPPESQQVANQLPDKKSNKNRIRKKGI